jgi:hypothetical protein
MKTRALTPIIWRVVLLALVGLPTDGLHAAGGGGCILPPSGMVTWWKGDSNALDIVGTWQPDGRAIGPLSAGLVFDSASRSLLLNSFNGADPNGTWSLFIADVSSGGEGTLVNWGLSITAVPEPASGFLVIGGLAALWWRTARRIRTRQG